MLDHLIYTVRYTYPGLPGGLFSIVTVLAILFVLFFLWRRSRWGGWAALILSICVYSWPILASYHR